MPIPTTHKARVTTVYQADDGNGYLLKVPTTWQASGTPLSLAIATQADLGAFKPLPANWRPRHVRAETTDGVDGDGNYHVFSRNFVVQDADTVPGATCAPGATFTYEGCNWQIKGRVGERHFDR
ncbi:MAG: hypothetical protein ABJA67_05555 [Chthonomonadales bacterium]